MLTIGDSYTFGWLLEWEHTYAAGLQSLADQRFGSGRVTMLNAGAGGWGTADYVAFVEDFGEQVMPDAILVFLNVDDMGRSVRSRLWRLDDDGGLERLQVPKSRAKALANAIPGYQTLLENSHLMQLLRAQFTKADSADPHAATTGPVSDKSRADAERAQRLGKALFERLDRWCDEHEVALWVTTTGWHRPDEGSWRLEPTVAFMRTAPELFERLGVPFHDVTPSVRPTSEAERETLIIVDEGHPNEAGAARTVDAVWRQFLEARLAERLGAQATVQPR